MLHLTPGRSLHTRVAGIFLFLPLLARLQFDPLVNQANYPGSHMVSALSALLSLLALKLLDKERRSHINDFNFDEALGFFAGLNILPKTTSSYRIVAGFAPSASRVPRYLSRSAYITSTGRVLPNCCRREAIRS